jgi:acyl-coenzyme A synthetase/AMP-(fatty) acid ligase
LNAKFSRVFAEFADRPAIYTSDGQVLTFARVERTVSIIAKLLRENGVQEGDNVICAIDHFILNLCTWFAVWRLGANLLASDDPRNFDGSNLSVDAVLTFEASGLSGPNIIQFSPKLLAVDPVPIPVSPAGFTYVPTNHSTRDQRVLGISAGQLLNDALTYSTLLGPATGPIFMTTSLDSMRAFRDVFRTFLSGYAVIGPDVTPAQAWQLIADCKVHELFLAPLSLHRLLNEPDRPNNAPDVTRIFVASGTAQVALLNQASEYFECAIDLAAGTAETSLYAFKTFQPGQHNFGDIGPVQSGIEARIEDADGGVVAIGDVGRLALRTPKSARFTGYINGPDAYDENGWMYPGFLASIAPSGEITKHGRTDDRINLGGTRYFSGIIENLLDQLPYVKRSCAMRVFSTSGAEALGIVVDPSTEYDRDKLLVLLQNSIQGIGEIIVSELSDIPIMPNGTPDRELVRKLIATPDRA